MSETNKRSVASDGSVAWPSVGMISENRLRELMADVGWPYSRSLRDALRQCDVEARLDVVARLRITDAEREAIERLCEATNESIADDKRADGCHWQDDAAAVAVVRGLLERLG